MPRGVAIPELRQRLFAAAERVIDRDGPARLSGRSVTIEAGVATGLLYAHFADFDDFLAGYAVDRAFMVSAEVAALPARAGTGTVADNLADALPAVPLTPLRTLLRLLVARPDLVERVTAVLGDDTTGLDAVERATAAYLHAEQHLGRLAAHADPAHLALAVTATLHHLALAPTPDAAVRDRLRPAITTLIAPLQTARHAPGQHAPGHHA